MDVDLKNTFEYLKPACDLIMLCPSWQNISEFMKRLENVDNKAINALQQYILFPFITHVKSEEMEKKEDLLRIFIETMEKILTRIKITSYEMTIKIVTSLLTLIFDNSKTGMVADVSEELKLAVIKCLTMTVLRSNGNVLTKLLQNHVPLIAQIVFVAVHIAKLEKLRVLRIAAVDCVTAYTLTHPHFTNKDSLISDQKFESLAMGLLPSILPGLLAALQDVATANDNPGYSVIVSALNAIHRILCVAMNDKYLPEIEKVTADDFAKVIKENANTAALSEIEKKPKDLEKRSPEWYKMAGEKLTVITKSVIALKNHEHYQVRKELAAYCGRLLKYCHRSMHDSVPLVLEVLISLSRDEYQEVADYCSGALSNYLACSEEKRNRTMDTLGGNFFALLNNLPRILNDIDSARKLSALNTLGGYVQLLQGRDGSRPQLLTSALSVHDNLECLCEALLEAATVRTDVTVLTQISERDLTVVPPQNSQWCKLQHLDSPACERELRMVCELLGDAECAELIVDRLMELFQQRRSCEAVYVINWMASASKSPINMSKRVIDMYIEEDVWYLPLEVDSGELPITDDETLDVTVYNPRAWIKDNVPGLYEGATETRYTDISYQTPRVPSRTDPTKCGSLREAQKNLVLTCLLTEGVGLIARKLKEDFQPYLLKTLCLVLERLGSKYELQHKAGLNAVHNIAIANNQSLSELVTTNADYLAHQVTVMLKKSWKIESALQLLSIILDLGDTKIMDFLYGIIENVLVQSFDKYHQRDSHVYMRLFRDFFKFIHKWFANDKVQVKRRHPIMFDPLKELQQYIRSKEEMEQTLKEEALQDSGGSIEEMYKEDLKRNEENFLDYDDKVTEERKPPPQHVTVTITVLKRCINFIGSPQREVAIAALQATAEGLHILREHEDELLPLVHAAWAPLVTQYNTNDFAVMKAAFTLFVMMAQDSKDFIKNRAVKELLPLVFKQMHKCSKDSYLKDYGSAYRNSHAFRLQEDVLNVLTEIVVKLGLEDENLEEAMACCITYLSNKQPLVLQQAAVSFFQHMLIYDYGATWYHLRSFCNNTNVVEPPQLSSMTLEPVIGTATQPENKEYEKNIESIFQGVKDLDEYSYYDDLEYVKYDNSANISDVNSV